MEELEDIYSDDGICGDDLAPEEDFSGTAEGTENEPAAAADETAPLRVNPPVPPGGRANMGGRRRRKG